MTAELTKTPFFEDKFSVDSYLSDETQRIPLKNLLEELKVYRSDLQNLMTDILRTETESIVHLAESLTQLTTKIRNLFVPISQFKEEIKLLSDGVISSKKNFEEKVAEILNHYDKTQYKIYQQYMFKEIMMVDTLINLILPHDLMYEQLLKKGIGHNEFLMSYIKEKGLKDVNTDCLKELHDFHLELITDLFVKALKHPDKSGIVTILKMYKSVHAYSVAESVYRKNFIQPALDKIFYHKVKSTDGDQLTSIFENSLSVLNSEVTDLHKLIELNPAIHGFNFIVNSYWLEIDKHLQEMLHHYTAPGNPELFQKRYKSIWNYFHEIMSICHHFKIAYDVKLFEEHIKCFNLAVYYEIRYQQISTRFECAIINNSKSIDDIETNSNVQQNELKLKIASEFWHCTELCFYAEIFINQLIENFIKLSMLLLSRLMFYFTDISQRNEQEKNYAAWEKFYVYSLHDLNILLNRYSILNVNDFDGSVFAIVSPNMRPTVLRGIEANRNTVLKVCDKLRSNLIELVNKISYSHLQNVSSIPRLYRKTNKDVPMQSSNYVAEGVKPITLFYTNHNNALQKDMDVVMDLLVKQIGELYFDAINDVLQSVCKVEESLRRLKHRNMTSSVEEGNVHSDESKIKQQIKLDVGYFVDKLKQFSKGKSDAVLKKLKELI